jgi:hypothetical protein
MGEALSPNERTMQRSAVVPLFATLLWRAELQDDLREHRLLGQRERSGRRARRTPPSQQLPQRFVLPQHSVDLDPQAPGMTPGTSLISDLGAALQR